jgi:hypothetical protein
MNVLILNPHRSDFIYNSFAYKLLGRRSLKKYIFLQKFINDNNTDFYFSHSSLYNLLKTIKFEWLDFIFLYFERYFFYKINRINKKIIKCFIQNKNYDVAFSFGFAIRDINIEDLKNISKTCKKTILHLSHYHVFSKQITLWSQLNNIQFCSDVDLSNNYYYKYFINNNVKHFVLSYVIDDKFIDTNKFINRENKVISTGTFHEFEKIYSKKSLINFPISNIFGYNTLHPERRLIYYYSNYLKYLDCNNNIMGTINFRNLLNFKSNTNQKTYFKTDIVNLYNKYKFSFVGEESITGLPGIGIFESILCGCIPIINPACYKGTPLENNTISINYNNGNDLIYIIDNLHNEFNKIIDHESFNKLKLELKNFYSVDFQLKKLYENL